MRADRRPVAVGLVPNHPLTEVIESAARRLGVELAEGTPREGRPTIGDVTLQADAEEWHVEAALLRATEPRHVLFLCVANSARSQLAEGIARHLASGSGPGGRPMPVTISSAGSEPSSVRPQAVAVLDEIGIDISGQRSKGVDEIEGPVDAVITLCAEEVCPVWLGDARRVHWGLPDPAAVQGTEEDRLAAFRATRDELAKRLGVLIAGRAL